MPTIMSLPYELIEAILQAVPDSHSLLASLRVCRAFYDVALPLVYNEIVFDDGYKGRTGRALSAVEKHPDLIGCVRRVRHVARDMYIQTSDFMWTASLARLYNLCSYTLSTPRNRRLQFVPLAFVGAALHAMASCPNLKEVYLDFHLTSSYISTLTDLADVPALKSVGFGRPSGLFLVRAAEWLPRVPHITGLHVLDATEVNPERFRQVLPGLHNITSLTLGPDHSLSPLTLLDTLWSLPQVEQLSVSYYNIPAELDVLLPERLSLSPSGLRNLHTFMVHHADVTSAPDYTALFSWIRSLVDSSPLRSLELVPMDASVCDNPAELLYIIRSKETMKRVVAEHVFVRRETAAALMRESGVKEVRFGVYPDVDAGERGITDHGRRDEVESASYSAISAVI